MKNKSLYKKLMNLTESSAEKKKILNLMVKRGNKPEDAKKEIDKNYDYIKRTYKNSPPAKKAEILSNLSQFESVHNYTYGVGDVVKDVNPTCPHNGAMGTVKSINPKSVVFMVINKGKNYKPGDMLDKTHDQMKKVEYVVGKKPVEERKNPKREKVKRDFLKNLKNTEKIIKKIKGYASYNYWGDIGITVEGELVNNVRDLAKQTKIISKVMKHSHFQQAQTILPQATPVIINQLKLNRLGREDSVLIPQNIVLLKLKKWLLTILILCQRF